MIGVHYKELCRFFNQFTTRGALTTETFQIAKNGIVKLLEEIDESLENVSVTTTTRGTKNIVEKKSSNEAGNTSKEMVIRGWKIKEKKFGKSGKRPISGLEKSTRRRKLSQINVSLSNDAVAHTKSYDRVQNFNNGEKGISFPAVVESSSSPTLSQLSQVDKSSSSTVYPIERPSLLHMEPFQFANVFNPVVQQQVNISQYSREDGQSKMSMTELLQVVTYS